MHTRRLPAIRSCRAICTSVHIAFLLAVLLLAACQADPVEMVPSLTLQDDGIHGDTTLDSGESFSLHLVADGRGINLTHLLIRSTGGNGTQVWLDSGFNAPVLEHVFHSFKGLDSLETWEVIVRNRQSDMRSVSFRLHLGQLVFGQVRHVPGIRLTAQQHTDTLCFYSIVAATSYTPGQAFLLQDSAELVYYYGPDQHTLASPGANIEGGIFPASSAVQLWGTRHTARFKETTLSFLDCAGLPHDSLLIAAYGSGDGKRKAKAIAAGDVISFTNWDGRLGLIHVSSLTGQAAGEAFFDIWIQEP